MRTALSLLLLTIASVSLHAETGSADYPVKGVVTRVIADRGIVVVKHEEITGVMRAMTMAFQVEAETIAQLSAGQALLGRIERQGRNWHLFSVKLLGSPKTKTP